MALAFHLEYMRLHGSEIESNECQTDSLSLGETERLANTYLESQDQQNPSHNRYSFAPNQASLPSHCQLVQLT